MLLATLVLTSSIRGVAHLATAAVARAAPVAAAARSPASRRPRRGSGPGGRGDPGARGAPAGRLGPAVKGPASPATGRAGGAPAESPGAPGEGGALAQAGEGDFLGQNGLASPFCSHAPGLTGRVRANCADSGFTAAPAPTGNYAFDVHIDTGWTHASNILAVAVEDMMQWVWMALVALVRGLLVALEWCYSLNLLGGAILGEVARAMRGAQATFTAPGLAVVLAMGAVLLAYEGLVRRRVAQTLGQAVATIAMTAGGLWMIADPGGTLGTLAGWADRVGVAAVGALAAGSPEHPDGTLAGDLGAAFGDVITGPWCYMEFGSVAWCRDPHRLDPRLRGAALHIAREARGLAAGRGQGASARRSLLAGAGLLEGARTNGAVFLAMPANGLARNSINESGSLLSVLCGGSPDATRCSGPTAAQAQFRTEHGTVARVIGLVLIWLGALGMLGLFGWLALRLAGAALLALALLLLAPVAVLTPALGESGRAVFGAWLRRLFGAVMAKLLYSVLLGTALMTMNVLAGVGALGWWVQWALMSAFWWL
ncbi:MAG: hypothetical protein KGJ43_07345, partial [Acidobacteriota bacterium]|nr:hypothetical protein [Acidobacteriota bacterium]